MRGTNLSDETTITLNDDGSIILEVLHGEEVALVMLSAAEVRELRAFLGRFLPKVYIDGRFSIDGLLNIK